MIKKNITLKVALLAICCAITAILGFSLFTPVSVAAEETNPIKGVYMTLSDNLIVRYEFETTDTIDEGTLVGTFTLQKGEGDTEETKDVTTIDSYEEVNGKKVFSYYGITPQYMGKKLNFSVTYSVGGTSKTYTADEFSVLDYLKGCYDKKKQDYGYTNVKYSALKKVIADMLNYGGASQTYTNIDTENLVSSNKDYIGEATDVTKLSPASCLNEDYNGSTDLTWQYANLSLGYNVTMNLGFSLAKTENVGTLTAKVTRNGSTTTDTAEVVQANGTYKITYSKISVEEFDTELSFQVYEDDTAVGNALTYSVATYVKTVSDDTTNYNANTIALAKAVYAYGNAAKDYDKYEVYTANVYEEGTTVRNISSAENKTDGAFPASDSPEIDFLKAHDYSGSGYNGKTFKYEFNSSKAGKVQLDVIVSSKTTSSALLSDIMTITLNDNAIDVTGLSVENPNGIKWTYFDSVAFEVELKEGNNVLSLVLKNEYNFSGVRIVAKDNTTTIGDYTGARTFECEDKVKLTGFQNWNVYSRFVSNVDVGNIGTMNGTTPNNGGDEQTLTWFVNSNKDCTVNGTLRAASDSATGTYKPSEKLPITVTYEDETSAVATYPSETDSVTPAGWSDYKEAYFTLSLKAGINKITLKPIVGVNLNNYTLAPNDETVCLKTVMPYEDSVKMECEHYQSYGYTPSKGGQYDTGGASTATYDFDATKKGTSGGRNLGFFANSGYVFYSFFASKAGEVKMTLVMAVGDYTGTVKLEEFMGVQVNGIEQTITPKEFTATNNWQYYTKMDVTLNVRKGMNHLYIYLRKTTYSSGGANLDYLTLDGKDSGVQVCENWQYR